MLCQFLLLADMPHHEYRNVLFPGKMLHGISNRSCAERERTSSVPFPVTVIGVTVEEARGASTGVPDAATEPRRQEAITLKVVDFILIVEWSERKQASKETRGKILAKVRWWK
jgi:hypothetical protein